MRCLADTHALLWYAQGNPSLSVAARRAMETGTCFFSVASLWEIAIKLKTGKLAAQFTISEFARFLEHAGLICLGIESEHLDRIAELPDIHRDPFDRLLIAQALEENLTIVTTDGYIPQYPVQALW